MKKYFFILILLILKSNCFSQQKISDADSVILYLNQVKATQPYDTVAFNKAYHLIDQGKIDSTEIFAIQKASEIFYNEKDYDWYQFLQLVMYDRLINMNALKNARIFSEDLRKHTEGNHNRIIHNLLVELLNDFQGFYSSEKDITEYYTNQLKYYLASKDSDAISICYFKLGCSASRNGLKDVGIYDLKKSISYLRYTRPYNNAFWYEGYYAWSNHTSVIGSWYANVADYKNAIKYSEAAQQMRMIHGDSSNYPYTTCNIAYAKLMWGKYDNLIPSLNIAVELANYRLDWPALARCYEMKGFYYLETSQFDSAEVALQQCKKVLHDYHLDNKNPAGVSTPDYYLAQIRMKQNKLPEAKQLLEKELPLIEGNYVEVMNENKLLIEVDLALGKNKEAADAFSKYSAALDALKIQDRKNRINSFESEQKIDNAENLIGNLETAKQNAAVIQKFSIGIAVLILLLLIIIYSRYRAKQKLNLQLTHALHDLKEAQEQLVANEKMAAFGVVASRMSHEILNPLNFVINFSDLSEELLHEHLESTSDDEKKILIDSLKDNLKRIKQQGNRAATIVKQLQEHTLKGSAHEFFNED